MRPDGKAEGWLEAANMAVLWSSLARHEAEKPGQGGTDSQAYKIAASLLAQFARAAMAVADEENRKRHLSDSALTPVTGVPTRR